MKKIFFVFTALMYLINPLQASAENENPIPKIIELLPNLGSPFEVELYLPEDFALIRHASANNYSLGSKEISEAVFDTPEMLKSPIIEVKFAKNPTVTSFQEFFEEMASGLKEYFPQSFKATYSKWGQYPVLDIKVTIGSDDAYLALWALMKVKALF